MIAWILLAVACSPVLCDFTFRLNKDVLEVQGQDGRFLPLCFNSARQEYAEEMCGSMGSYLASFESIAVSSKGTYTIACVGDKICFPYLINYCKRGAAIKCSRDFCPSDSLPSGRQCIQVATFVSGSFSDAKEECSFHVLSLPRESDRAALVQLMFESFGSLYLCYGLEFENDSITKWYGDVRKQIPGYTDSCYHTQKTYFTSGYRGGSQWIWEDGTPIDFPVPGQGRCLAVTAGVFHAIECDSAGTALCEVPRECIYHETYYGRKNNTKNGLPCMKWNDPSVLFYGITWPGQNRWDHNFCRILDGEGTPSCFTSPSVRSICMLPECPEPTTRLELKADLLPSKCGPAFFPCRDTGTCLPEEFRCDYEADCSDASDEENCEDHLQNFELVGSLKIADKVTEIWTYIPHVQGCARRCNESTLLCEAFSYETLTQICLLTDSSEVGNNLALKTTSHYYRKKVSTKDVHFQLVNFILRVSKNQTWGHVCDEGFSPEYATSICKIFGYGLALAEDPAQARRPAAEAAVVASSSAPLPSPFGWSVQCIRDASCMTLSQCSPLRACPTCPTSRTSLFDRNSVCGDGSCLPRQRLCDGVKDCYDGSDENECHDLTFRLIDINEVSENVQVSFKGIWQPVCSQGIGQNPANVICDSMNMGTPANVLAPGLLRNFGWQLQCDGHCSLRGFVLCQYGARIRCHSSKPNASGSCGIRRVPAVARDPLVTRFARVVGGFETAAGAFPWTAAIRNKATGAHHCGASVLDKTHLITAAHCFEEDRRPTSYTIVVGDWDNTISEDHEQTFNVSRFYFYPLYEDLFAHDLAIIEVPSPGMKFDDWTQPICLPPRDFTYQTGRKCVVSGWGSIGLTYPRRLQAAVLPIINRQECINSSRIYSSMSRSAFCAGYLHGGVDSCQGDSGGPLACQNDDGPFVLAGVISWGDGCAQKGQPGIYTMVAPYLTWIQGIVKKR